MNIHFRQKAIITNSEGKLLVMFDAKQLLWDLPGGHVDMPELHDDALRREVQEELGAKILSYTIEFIHTRHSTKSDNYHIVVCYQTVIDRTDIKLSDEHTEYKYVTPAEIFNLKTEPYLQELAKKLTA